jgi:hypothetical protein
MSQASNGRGIVVVHFNADELAAIEAARAMTMGESSLGAFVRLAAVAIATGIITGECTIEGSDRR